MNPDINFFIEKEVISPDINVRITKYKEVIERFIFFIDSLNLFTGFFKELIKKFKKLVNSFLAFPSLKFVGLLPATGEPQFVQN